MIKQVVRLGSGFLFFVLTTVLWACQNKQPIQNFTSGKTQILADESFAPIIEDELYVFESTYPNAKFEVIYKPEKEILNLFLNDSVRIAILSRNISIEEAPVLRRKNIRIRSNRFAVDGVALITHQSSPDTLIEVSDLVHVLKGNKTMHNSLVFDHANSGTVSYLMNLAQIKHLPEKGVYALKSNPEVIRYVHDHPGTIGVIGINWIRQPDPDLEKYISKIKVIGVKNIAAKPGSDKFYKPNQDNLALGLYPLTRDLYILNAQGGSGLGAGLASFLAGEQGQRIVLKSGLLPDSIPPREVLIRK